MIGKQLKQLRISKGISKYRLAKLAKVKHDIVVKVEDNKSATLTTLNKLANAMDAEIILQSKK